MDKILINNALIVDGYGNDPYMGHVLIGGDRILEIGKGTGRSSSADRIMDAEGMTLTPGFIDTHASTGLGYFFPHAADHKIMQGITTEIIGNCGTSPGPIGTHLNGSLQQLPDDIGFVFNWQSLDEYYSEVMKIGLPINMGSLVGHSTLRSGYVKDQDCVEDVEYSRIKAMMEEAMGQGALGLSTGLIYAPGCFAPTSELIDLARISSKYQGIYASHIRDERDRLEDAVEETLEVGINAHIDVLISHLKAAEKQNFGKIGRVLERLNRYNRDNRIKAKVDVYPYTAVSTKLKAFIPKYFLRKGIASLKNELKSSRAGAVIQQHLEAKGYEMSQMIVITEDKSRIDNKSILAIAEMKDITIADSIVDLLMEDPDCWIVYHCIDQKDMDEAIIWPQAMICTDSWSYPINAPHLIGKPHPRSYGAFTQFLYDYVLQRELISFQEAIRKMTSLPAAYFHLPFRGGIKTGNFADIALFDLSHLEPKATYDDPMQFSKGLVDLWINGQQVVSHGIIRQLMPGQLLKNNMTVS